MQGAPGLTDRRIALAPVGPRIARAAQMPFKRSRPDPPNLTCCSGWTMGWRGRRSIGCCASRCAHFSGPDYA